MSLVASALTATGTAARPSRWRPLPTEGADYVLHANGRGVTSRDLTTALLWAIARIWVGWQFLEAGLAKLGTPAQIRQLLGVALSPKMTGGAHPTVLGPYAWAIRHLFLPNAAPLATS